MPGWGKVAIGGLLVAFASLVAARYLTSRGLVLGLFGIALGLGVTLQAVLAGTLRWATRSDRTPALAAGGIAAGGALLGRAALLVTIGLDPEAAHTIDPATMGTAAIALTSAFAGLGWSVIVLGRRPTPGWPHAMIATLCASACLYTLGPLLLSLGMPVSPWTFLSLAALGVAFYGAQRALSRS